jgi:hypothetical protein
MRIARTIVTLLTAIAVAALPVAGALAMPQKTSDEASMSAQMAVVDHMSGHMMAHDHMMHHDDMAAISGAAATADDMACCPHQGDGTGKPMNHGDCAAACASGYVAVPAPASSLIVFALLATSVMPPVASNPLGSQPSSPPFRPPRI